MQRQLEGLDNGQLLTADQLHFSCCARAVSSAHNVAHSDSPCPADQLAEVHASATSSARALRQLEPESPAGSFWEADAALITRGEPVQRFEYCLRSARLAQQQRSDYWTIHTSVAAVMLATNSPQEVGHTAFAAAVELYEQEAEPALRRCRRLLPEAWVAMLQQRMQVTQKLLPGAHKQLRLLQLLQPGSTSASASASGEAFMALLLSVDSQQVLARQQMVPAGAVERMQGQVACDSCGKQAVGLRRCARCRQAQYCRCAVVLPCPATPATLGLLLPCLACTAHA